MADERRQVIERIYCTRPELWPDVRRYTRPSDILSRLHQLRDRIKLVPPKKRDVSYAEYARLINEFRLLKAQVAVLSVDPGDEKDRDLWPARALIDRALMRHAGSHKVSSGDAPLQQAHTVILMHFALARYTDTQLHRLQEKLIQ
jgi:hypothetical protein